MTDREHTLARFRQELRFAFNHSGRSARSVALAMGASPESLRSWLDGRSIPLPAHGPALAEELNAPHLAELIMTIRTVTCAVCGRRSIDTTRGGARRVYCGTPCKSTAVFRRRREARATSSALIRHRLTEHQDAVEAHCRECTLGEGLCPLWTCNLRPVSPLALAPEARRAMNLAQATAAA